MSKRRPGLDSANNRVPAELKAPGNCRRAAEFRKAMAKYWIRQYNAANLSVDSGSQAFDRHAALLDDSRLSGSGIQRAMIVRKLQRDYGTGYVQRLIEHSSRRRVARVQAKIIAGPSWDQKIAE